MNIRERFLRGIWNAIPSETDLDWVHKLTEIKLDDSPLGDCGVLVHDMLNKGVTPYDIARFAKIMSYETVFSFCYHIADPECFDAENEDVDWGLFRLDEKGQPVESIDSLHETILSMDPTGREMRPKK